MLKALLEQNKLVGMPTRRVRKKYEHKDLYKIFREIDPYMEVNKLSGNAWEYMIHGNEPFQEILEYLDSISVECEVTQDGKGSTKIFEIDYDEI